MKKLFFLLMCGLPMAAFTQQRYFPPVTPVIPVVDTLHGMLLTDNYRWLEDKTDPAVISWTKAQHESAVAYMKANQKEHPGLRDEITAYIDMDYQGPLDKQGKRIFQSIRKKGDKQISLYTILDGKKILILDPVKLDTTGKTSTTGVNYTYDGERAAVSVQKSGAEISTTYIIDTRTGKILYPPLENTFGYQWTKDQQHAYFTLRSQEDVNAQRPLKTYYWKVGDPLANAQFIGTTDDAKISWFIYDNRYGDVTFSGRSDFNSNNCYIRKTGSLEEGKLIYESKKFQAYPNAIGNKLYILTNDNAPRYRFMVADKDKPEYKDWKELIPEGETVLQNVEVLKDGRLIVQDKKDIQSRLTLFDANGKKIGPIELPEIGNVSGFNFDREEDSVYIYMSTFTSPGKMFVASPRDFKWRLYYHRELPIDMSNITGEINFYYSKDSTRVPVIVVHRKDMKLDGNNPVLLTAYGGFNIGITPDYYGGYAAFINRGGVIVEPGIRGGDEYGEKWHEEGMLLNKQNCFDDFNACAEWLIREKYTNPGRLAAEGGSNGGLLMGAVATQRPDLYKAILCAVPLIDMIRFHKFLIARYWIPEYGSSDNEPDFRNLLRYSPYHNIRLGINLPTMLIRTGANDSRVDPLHAKKFAAALQNNPGQINPILLFIDYNVGHGSGQATKQKIDNAVVNNEFLMNQLGM
ncbi:MAG: prolyl oligopeptidase family serine peptidase [Bacteroidales bacterium]|nr:prolyl oligopeptidase family serine peptidase [Bacteroidales bacterium]